jgi:hypothetical protein
VVTCIHDASTGDERSAERGNQYDEGAPDFAFRVENVQFRCEVQGEIEQASERDFKMSVCAVSFARMYVPLLCPEGKLLNPSFRIYWSCWPQIVLFCKWNSGYVTFHIFSGRILQLHSVNECIVACGSDIPADQVRSWLSNRILQGSGDCESCADAQTQSQDATIQFPQAIFEPVSPAQALDASPARGPFCLVREQAIKDQSIYPNDGAGREHDVDEEPWYWHALFHRKGVVQGIIIEREVLVEGRYLVDSGKDSDE